MLALSVAFAADPPGAPEPPKKSDAELLYEKLLEANVKEADKAYSQYLKALEVANKKILAGLEATKKDLNDMKKFKNLDIAARAKAIEEIDAKILEVKKGAVGEVIVKRAESDPAGDLLGEKQDLASKIIGKWLWTNVECVFDKKGNISGRPGTWKIEDDKILLSVNGWVHTMTIDETGNMVGSRNDGGKVTLTKIADKK